MANTEQNLRRELGEERERLTEAVGELREEIDEAKTLGAKVRSRLPIAAAVGALGVGFVKAGGIGAIARAAVPARPQGRREGGHRPQRACLGDGKRPAELRVLSEPKR